MEKVTVMFYTRGEINEDKIEGIAMVSKMERIASFDTPIQAHIARNALEAAGIAATLSNESLAGNAWHLGGAIGGVQLHVAAENVEAALQILSERHSADDNPETSECAADDQATQEVREEGIENGWDEEEGDSEITFETEADRLAKRAIKSGIFGLILPILQLYTLWLLLLFCFEPTQATARSRWQVVSAWGFCLISIAFMLSLFYPALLLRK